MKIMRKLILGAVSTGFVAVALAATTYAWYKLGNVAFAEEFEFNAATTEGFVVSVDGTNWKHSLKTADMIKAMIVGKNPNDYEFADDGSLIDKRNGNIKLSDSAIKDARDKVLALEPVTSYDGKTMKGLSGGTINSANEYNSKYVYFNLYFKPVSENKKYQIYLDGKDYDGTDPDNPHVKAKKTEIWSKQATTVNLIDKMVVWDGSSTGMTLNEGDTVQVYTANASRFSTQNLGYLQNYKQITTNDIYNSDLEYFTREGQGTENNPYSYSLVEISEFEEGVTYYIKTSDLNMETSTKPNGNSLIYEISSNSASDLGSFATNYDSSTDTRNIPDAQKKELDRLYNCKFNSMYTYYNNVKKQDKLDERLPNYATDLPSTIRSLVTKDDQGNTINRKDVIATLESGQVTKVGFRFWIEGWDGDCFDGLPGYYNFEYVEYTGEYDETMTYYVKENETFVKAIITSFNPNTTYYTYVREEKPTEANPINARLLFNSIKVD